MRIAGSVATVLTVLLVPQLALAQRAAENAVNNADDAFGTAVGLETSGIYSEFDTRGFSPSKAGNVRIDGVYADTVSVLSGRLRQSTAIRIGFAAEEYPFAAPTGIVDHKFRPFPEKNGTSFATTVTGYMGNISEWDLRLRDKAGIVAITAGLAYADNRFSDGSYMHSWGWTIRPIFRPGRFEIAPWAAKGTFTTQLPRTLAITTGDFLPKVPPRRKLLGQSWAKNRNDNSSFGVTVKGALTDGLSLRGGMTRVTADRTRYFSELFVLVAPDGSARHRLIADPAHDIGSTSGEMQLAWRLGSGRVTHRFIAGFRGRDRRTDSGGSHVENFPGLVIYGTPDPRPKPARFNFGPINQGRVVQTSLLAGYTGKIEGLGLLNLGLQKARYRARNRIGSTGIVTRSKDDPWLYNATLGVDLTHRLSAYVGTQRGLEDSGSAPENAINRNEQLPATRTTQIDGGLRWRFPGGQAVVSAFEIEKPYFSFDATGLFAKLGQVRNRGIEGSVSGHFGKRLHVVAGAVLMRPEVSGQGRKAGLVGKRPTGVPGNFVRIDANYRTDIFGGLTPTFSLIHTGKRAVGARPLSPGGDRQLMVPGMNTIDLGLRQQFRIGKVPTSVRASVLNVFDTKNFKVLAPNTLTTDERRRFSLALAADF